MVFYEINRISTLSFEEMIAIVAAFHSIGAKETDYSRYSESQIEAMRKAERFNPIKSLGLLFTKPLRNFPCDEFDYYTLLYGQYDKHGTLPFPGSLAEQPAAVIEIFNVLKALVNEAEEKERKNQERRK